MRHARTFEAAHYYTSMHDIHGGTSHHGSDIINLSVYTSSVLLLIGTSDLKNNLGFPLGLTSDLLV